MWGERRVGVRCIAWLDLVAGVPRLEVFRKDNDVRGVWSRGDFAIPASLAALRKLAACGEAKAAHLLRQLYDKCAVRARRHRAEDGVRNLRDEEQRIQTGATPRFD